MLLVVNVCCTLRCHARYVFYGTLSRVWRLMCHWLAAPLPRQHASTAVHVAGREPSGAAVLIGLWNSNMHPILRDSLPPDVSRRSRSTLFCTRAQTPGKTVLPARRCPCSPIALAIGAAHQSTLEAHFNANISPRPK